VLAYGDREGEVATVNVFVVQLEDRPGELATLLERLAAANVNVMVAAITSSGTGTVTLVGDDDAATREALSGAGYSFDARHAIKVRAAHRAGEGAAFCRLLADAGVNIELVLPLTITQDIAVLVLGVDDPAKAEAALGDRVLPD
jgi:hypothetical protein